MTQFWIYATGLIILAMAFIALPLLRKQFRADVNINELNLSVFKQQLAELDSDLQAGNLDQDRYDAAKRDLEKGLLEDVPAEEATETSPVYREGSRLMALSALAVPIVAVLLYQWLGSPEIAASLAEGNTGMSRPADTAGNPHANGGANTQGMPPLDQMVKQLAAKLESEPENIEGWVMLGRSYMAMKRFPDAVQVYDRAMKVNAEHVGLLLAYGEALGINAGNNFMGRPAEMINKAFDLEPENPNTLWMSGIVAYQQSDFKTALTRWEKVQARLSPQSQELESVGKAIDDARSKLGLPPIDRPLPKIAQGGGNMGMGRPANMGRPGNMGQPGSAAASGKSAIQVEISLSPELSAKTKPGDMLFIYAKALSGPPMPLAAARKRVSDLPLTLQLDDSMAMMPQMKLSSFPKVLVGARVSLSGTPTAQSGDLEGEVKPVTPGQSEPVKLVINSVHP